VDLRPLLPVVQQLAGRSRSARRLRDSGPDAAADPEHNSGRSPAVGPHAAGSNARADDGAGAGGALLLQVQLAASGRPSNRLRTARPSGGAGCEVPHAAQHRDNSPSRQANTSIEGSSEWFAARLPASAR